MMLKSLWADPPGLALRDQVVCNGIGIPSRGCVNAVVRSQQSTGAAVQCDEKRHFSARAAVLSASIRLAVRPDKEGSSVGAEGTLAAGVGAD